VHANIARLGGALRRGGRSSGIFRLARAFEESLRADTHAVPDGVILNRWWPSTIDVVLIPENFATFAGELEKQVEPS